jgi:transcriptional regulator with XRE-family HTH domain
MEKIIITSEQCRAARELLRWKQIDLAQKSGISTATIADFEREYRKLSKRTITDIKRTFEEAGIEFINDDQKIGAVVLKK